MNIVIDYPHRFIVPDTGTYMQIRRDFETAEWNYQTRANKIGVGKDNPEGWYPDTCRAYTLAGGIGEDVTVPLSRSWQIAWYGLLQKACHRLIPDDILKQRWAEITEHGRALTDGNAVQQGYADYVLGLNIGAKPIRQKMLTMGGNVVKVTGGDAKYVFVEALDLSQDPPAGLSLSWSHLVHWGTQTAKDGRVSDWGQLNWGGVGYGVPFLFVSPSGSVVKIPRGWLKPVSAGEYKPYQMISRFSLLYGAFYYVAARLFLRLCQWI